ncbi:MAG TPA: MXAN_5187 C-terminal domain-containing protein [Candidatus Acidoferrales bacterium]|nr:MXAN_5187 C-terminal domain-containing protein [Candidatus Acidoferrales bacterium]
MAKTVDEDLAQLEKDIRQLKIEYEQYFGGGKARPPAEIEWRIETLMKRYSDRGADMNYGQRFRYGNLTQMYTKYRQVFRKRMKEKEEGTVQRHFGAAAREIEADRARRRAEAAKSVPLKFPFAVSWDDPDHEKKKVEQLFEAFRDAKERSGEDTAPLSIEAFQRFVRQKTEQLKKQKQAHEVEYVVTVEGNHARLKVRVKS